jgi:Rieske Fe-S protein
MTRESRPDSGATRRGVLLGAGLAGVGGALAGCSTTAVPYDAGEAGAAPGGAPAQPATAGTMSTATGGAAPAARQPAGTVLATAAEIPVGGGKAFTDKQVVVTQPVKGEFKAFSAVCTHVGCICDKVADGTIDCPCHGSKFKITNGAVVAGPATAPLSPRTISVTGGNVTLAD